MAKAERLEDLGRIRERLASVMEHNLWELCESKHDLDPFQEAFEDNIYELHCSLRYIKEMLDDILCLSIGDFSDEE